MLPGQSGSCQTPGWTRRAFLLQGHLIGETSRQPENREGTASGSGVGGVCALLFLQR